MKQSLNKRSIQSLGVVATATAVLVSLLIPTAQAQGYSLPAAPTGVTSHLSSHGIVVNWTPATDVTPAVTGYVVSAGAGSCPIFVTASRRSGVTMPVVVGQPGGTPFVQHGSPFLLLVKNVSLI